MPIREQLVKPLIWRLFEDYRELERQMVFHACNKTDEIKALVREKMHELEKLGVSAMTREAVTNRQFQRDIRQLKLNYRFIYRRWKRHLMAEERIRKQQRNGAPFSVAAA